LSLLPFPQSLSIQYAPSLANPFPPLPFPPLIQGGSTAVGHHAIQLAVLSGLTVYTTASPKNHDFLLSLGATRCFSYSDKDVVEQIKEASGGKIQYAIDCACEKGSTDMTVDCLRAGGGKVATTLPFSDETKNRRKEVDLEFVSRFDPLPSSSNSLVLAKLETNS
jgi:NADPH:quinone reductase-like Zn-dependent oxidoreductase